jgi:hypothetical protein
MSASTCAIGVPSDFMLSVPQSTKAIVSGNALPSAVCRASSSSARLRPSMSAYGLGTL